MACKICMRTSEEKKRHSFLRGEHKKKPAHIHIFLLAYDMTIAVKPCKLVVFDLREHYPVKIYTLHKKVHMHNTKGGVQIGTPHKAPIYYQPK